MPNAFGAEKTLRDGGRVIVDASFAEERRRAEFLDAARKMGVPGLLLDCKLTPELAHERLSNRKQDASDAGWEIYEEMASRWEHMSEATKFLAVDIDTSDAGIAVNEALRTLRQIGLLA